MGIDIYMLRWLAEARLAEARAHSARRALVRSLRPGRADALALLALVLIRAGRRLGRRQGRNPRGPRLATLTAR